MANQQDDAIGSGRKKRLGRQDLPQALHAPDALIEVVRSAKSSPARSQVFRKN
jgi:hypothetical protein